MMRGTIIWRRRPSRWSVPHAVGGIPTPDLPEPPFGFPKGGAIRNMLWRIYVHTMGKPRESRAHKYYVLYAERRRGKNYNDFMRRYLYQEIYRD